MFKTIKEKKSSEITIKKSKFIGNIYYIENEEEANKIIKETKQKYHDARHNCFAYKINQDNISRFSDDGEPSGTAGAPILSIIEGEGLENVLIIVTRYFGGILLGTGGLVRAYSDCASKVVSESQIIKKDLGIEAIVEVGYKNLEKIKYYFDKNDIVITNSEYKENVILKIELSNNTKEKLEEAIRKKEITVENIKKLKEKYVMTE